VLELAGGIGQCRCGYQQGKQKGTQRDGTQVS